MCGFWRIQKELEPGVPDGKNHFPLPRCILTHIALGAEGQKHRINTIVYFVSENDHV